MKIHQILKTISEDSNCKLTAKISSKSSDIKLPEDLSFFYENYDSIEFFLGESYGIKIVSLEECISTNRKLYPSDDVIWEELEGDISNDWYVIASAEELSQYISIDLSDRNFGYCYDSYIETHANPDDSPIIAKSFTELLENIYKAKGKDWFWLSEGFKNYGDAYEGVDI